MDDVGIKAWLPDAEVPKHSPRCSGRKLSSRSTKCDCAYGHDGDTYESNDHHEDGERFGLCLDTGGSLHRSQPSSTCRRKADCQGRAEWLCGLASSPHDRQELRCIPQRCLDGRGARLCGCMSGDSERRGVVGRVERAVGKHTGPSGAFQALCPARCVW